MALPLVPAIITASLIDDSQAIGRDEDNAHVSPWGFSTEMYVPQVRNGILQYILMEVLLPSDHSGEAALLRAKATRPPPPVPVTSMMPKTNYIMSNSF